MDTNQQDLFTAQTPGELALAWDHAPDLAFSRWMETLVSPRDGLPYNSVSKLQFQSMWAQYSAFLRLRSIPVSRANAGQIQDFLEQHRSARGKPLSAVTARRYVALLARVYRELVAQDLCEVNPLSNLGSQYRTPLPQAPVAHLPASLDQRFVAYVQGLSESTWKALRDKTMLLLLPGSGLTQSELLRLTEADLYLNEVVPYIQVPAVGRKAARVVSLSPFCVEQLRSWVAYRHEAKLLTDELFPARSQGGRLHPSTLYRHVDQVLQTLGVQQQRGARRLRHTFALRQLGAGTSEAVVKDWLGLETNEMLDRYRKLVPNRNGARAV